MLNENHCFLIRLFFHQIFRTYDHCDVFKATVYIDKNLFNLLTGRSNERNLKGETILCSNYDENILFAVY